MGKKNMIAFDCGNSSFRVVLGRLKEERLETTVIEQIPNETVYTSGYFYWDILRIYQRLLKALKKAVKQGPVDSIGICTWGVDFALFTKEGFMLQNPLSYRNSLGEEVLEEMDEEQRRELFEETGILCDKINSAYTLRRLLEKHPGLRAGAAKVLMIPDILNYFFTGVMVNEPSELSTTQLMDARTQKVSQRACELMGISPELFGPMGEHGKKIGCLLPEIKEYLEIDYDIPVICVPSHDTASAVLAVPAREKDFAYISSGTWALIGMELDQPLITPQVRKSSLTNEVGAFGKITLLKNNAGMFLIQRLKEEYEEQAGPVDWEELNALGDAFTGEIPLFDVNAPRFFNPRSMSREIWSFFLESGQMKGELQWSAIIRSFQVSMACSYGQVLNSLNRISGRSIEAVYIVGGGSQNVRLCQLAADICRQRILTGGKESTSVGNIAAQIKYFYPERSIEELRGLLYNSVEQRVYEPMEFPKEVFERYEKLSH